MTDAIGSHGTLLKIGDGGGTEVFTTIAELQDIDGPNSVLGTHDAPSQTSGAMERVPGILDNGEVSFPVNFIPTNATHDYQTGLIADMEAKTLRNFQLWFPDLAATKWEFAAYVTNVKPTGPVDGLLTADITIQLSGDIDHAAT